MIAFAPLLALVLAAASGDGPLLNADGLRKLALDMRKHPDAAEPARFRLDLPIVSDRKTDLGSLQNPAGYTYDDKTQILSIDIDFGAVTPQNYKAFDKQRLSDEPPLRMFFFDTRTTRDITYHTVDGERSGDTATAQGWRLVSTSVGLAIPTSAKDYGVKGGDLPDDFVLPFYIKFRVPPQAVATTVRTLRLRLDGELRTIGGKAVLCSDSTGDGYETDDFTQKTPNIIVDYMCLTPAVLRSVSLVRTTGGPPLKTWTRSAAAPLEESGSTAVIMAGTRNRDAPSLLTPQETSSPNATAPLPKRN